MHTSLVIMAAGLASRYGGNKQIAGMGPHGEILLEYSVHDAIRAGFDRVVFIIRPDMEAAMRQLCGDRLAKKIEVRYAFQDFSSIPDWYAVPEGRTKPFGTVHAVLCARDCVDGPFAVLNADDFYGSDAFARMHGFLASDGPQTDMAMIGYRLRNTVSLHGTVTRGICAMNGGKLTGVDEIHDIRLYPDGRIADTSRGEPGETLDGEALVSMNFWGFKPAVFPMMADYFDAFLKALPEGELKGECLLPVMVDALIRRGAISVNVLDTTAAWFGVTYQEDRPRVQAALRELHEKGIYGEEV